MNYDKILGHGLTFTRNDLAMNRYGSLSDRQFKTHLNRLIKRYRQYLFAYFGAILTLLIPFGVGLLVSQSPHFDRFFSILGVIVIVPILIVVYFEHRKMMRLRQELNNRVIEYVVGPVSVSTVAHRAEVNESKIRVWDTYFQASKRGAESFRHLDEYVIYYLPDTHTVVSAEPVERV